MILRQPELQLNIPYPFGYYSTKKKPDMLSGFFGSGKSHGVTKSIKGGE
jgi:hypothetical protein